MKMPPRKVLMPGKKEITKEDPVYKEKRNKNNDAVKKSRQKTKVKSEETMRKVAILKYCHNAKTLTQGPLSTVVPKVTFTYLDHG